MRILHAALFNAWCHNNGSRSLQPALIWAAPESIYQPLFSKPPLQQFQATALANNSPDEGWDTLPRLLSRVGLWRAYFRRPRNPSRLWSYSGGQVSCQDVRLERAASCW